MAFPEAIRLERGINLMLVGDHLAQVLRFIWQGVSAGGSWWAGASQVPAGLLA